MKHIPQLILDSSLPYLEDLAREVGAVTTLASRDFSPERVAEADDFHPEANIAKMSRGVPLTDEDRWPWLESLRAWMSGQADRGTRTIVTCSALKRSYRDLLAGAHGRVFFIHLVADENTLHERMERREGHFMPPALLPSQFADLEPLADDEDGVTVVSRATPEQTLEAILAAFETAPAAPDRSRCP